MVQLNLQVPEKIEKLIRKEAQLKGESVSAYLAQIIKIYLSPEKWSENFFTQVVGSWQGEFPNIEDPILKDIDKL